jgi:hypothetical protein
MSTTPARSVSDRDGHRLGARYVHLVASLPQVRRVLLEQTASGPRLWTIIAAEPFDDAQRDPVYQAELRALQEEPPESIDFRLLNVNEFPPESHASLLPLEATVLFDR